MALIDLTKLNQEQLWAIQWGVQTANEWRQQQITSAAQRNEFLTKENEKLLPEHQQPLEPVPELYTDQSWADEQIWGWVNSQLQAYQSRVKQNVEAKIAAMSLEERMQLMQQLAVEPVLKQ